MVLQYLVTIPLIYNFEEQSNEHTYLRQRRESSGSLTKDIKLGPCRPNSEKFRNLTSPSKLKGMASCLMMLVISSTSNSCQTENFLIF